MSVILKADFVPSFGEINGKAFGYFTETAGYRSSKAQIEGFLKAGQSLDAFRAGEYDSDEYEPEDDPSLDVRDMELSEIGALMNQTEEALEASASAASEALKGATGETGASVSPDTSDAKSDK